IWNGGTTGSDSHGLHVRNNILQTTGGVRLVEVTASQLDSGNEILFQGNDYFASGSDFQILWSGTTYTNLADWRTGATQEMAGAEEAGLSADPRLGSPGGGGTLGDADLLETLAAYEVRLDSTLIDAGLDLSALFGVDPGSQDYFGNALPQGEACDVGAHEVLYDSDADALADTWEWAHFQTLVTNATDDGDADGADNYHEFTSGTQPTSAGSVFRVTGLTNAVGVTNFAVTVATEPGRHYTVFFSDHRLSNGVPWSGFADTNNGVGTWTETNAAAATFTFLDDFTPSTTAGEPAGGGRCYRVKVENP
ncbi:MAG: hypothetical protein JXB04_09355, partial [Kiritimatiellae bacterium]|nr:hypothetical protein [Kiritimatiellia bacterium]